MNNNIGFFKGVGLAILTLCILLGLAWGVDYLNLLHYKFFAPRQAAVERDVFENTKSYKEGMIKDMRDYKIAYYRTTDKASKAAIASTILKEIADFPDEKIPSDLQPWINEMREAQ